MKIKSRISQLYKLEMIIFKQPIQNKDMKRNIWVQNGQFTMILWMLTFEKDFELESVSWQYGTSEEFVFLFSKIGDANFS